MHTAALITFGHLLVENAATCGHPLHISGAHGALVAETVAVLHAAAQHGGDGLDAAVRMPGESGEIIFGVLVAESSSRRNGSKSLVRPNPNARRSLTPAPSSVSWDCEIDLTARMDI